MESGGIHEHHAAAPHASFEKFLKKNAILSMSDVLVVPEHLLVKVVVSRYRNEPLTHTTFAFIMKDLHAAGLSPAYISNHLEGIFSKWLAVSTVVDAPRNEGKSHDQHHAG